MEPKNLRYALAGLAIVIVIAAAYFYVSRSEIAKSGDIVEIDYVGFLEDGTVFDTTMESVAKDPNVPKFDTFKLRIIYEPLRFEVGAGKTGLPRLEAAILGMNVGETKEVRIPPEEASGPKDPNLILTIDRMTRQPLRGTMEKKQFEEITGESPALGKTYKLGDLLIRIEEIKDEEVKFFHLVEANLAFETPYGTATVLSVSDTEFIFRVDTEVGKKTLFQGRTGRVTEVSEEKIIIDFNDPLAGQILIFRVTLLKIIKGSVV